MIHPDTTLNKVNDKVGLGVFTTKRLRKGTIIFVPDLLDRIVKPNDKILTDPNYLPLLEKYSYIDEYGNRVLSWDHAKYMNHHCEANTLSTAWGVDITVKDIEAGEELTCEYGLLNIERDMHCCCSAIHCRKKITSQDIKLFANAWDQRIKNAMENFSWQHQPLANILTMEVKHNISAFLSDEKLYKSIVHLEFQQKKLRGKLATNR